MSKEKVDFIKKTKIVAIFMALLTLFIVNAFNTSHLIKLLSFSISV